MLALLNILRSPNNKSLLEAALYEVPTQKATIEKPLGEPFKEITGKPAEFVTKFLAELRSQNAHIRFYHFSPKVPKDVQVLLYKALMNYWRADLPQTRGLIKISRDIDKKDLFNVVHFNSTNPTPDEYAPIVQDKNLIKLATKLFDALDSGFRHPVDLEFEEGIPESVKELISSVVDLYNKAVESKKEINS